MDNRLALMTGIDFPLNDCDLIIHQPSIKEISYLGELTFFAGAQLLCINKSMYDMKGIDLSSITNFDVLAQILNDSSFKEQKKQVEEVLNLLFPNYSILITNRSILFNQEGGTFILDERNFESFQHQLSQVLCLQQGGQQAYNPKGKKAVEIAQKLQRARERVIAQQTKGMNGSGSVFSQYLSAITVGINSMNLREAMELTIYQLYDLLERYSLYISWDIDIRSRLAGAKGDKPVENWMKSIH